MLGLLYFQFIFKKRPSFNFLIILFRFVDMIKLPCNDNLLASVVFLHIFFVIMLGDGNKSDDMWFFVVLKSTKELPFRFSTRICFFIFKSFFIYWSRENVNSILKTPHKSGFWFLQWFYTTNMHHVFFNENYQRQVPAGYQYLSTKRLILFFGPLCLLCYNYVCTDWFLMNYNKWLTKTGLRISPWHHTL